MIFLFKGIFFLDFLQKDFPKFLFLKQNVHVHSLTKIPHEHVPKSHVITCDFGTCSCGSFVKVSFIIFTFEVLV